MKLYGGSRVRWHPEGGKFRKIIRKSIFHAQAWGSSGPGTQFNTEAQALAVNHALTSPQNPFTRTLWPNPPNLSSNTGSFYFPHMGHTNHSVRSGPTISDSVQRGAHSPNGGDGGAGAKPLCTVPQPFRTGRTAQRPTGSWQCQSLQCWGGTLDL